MSVLKTCFACIILTLFVSDGFAVRLQSKVVTYPIAESILSRFSDSYGGKTKKYVSPLIVSGVGDQLLSSFCEIEPSDADVYVTNRKLNPQDFALCAKEGVNDFIELKLGFGAIVVLASPDLGIKNIGMNELYAATSKFHYKDGQVLLNSSKTWNEIASNGYQLTSTPMDIYVPAVTDLLRDVFNDRIMVQGCQGHPEISRIKEKDPTQYKELCLGIRSDNQVKAVNFYQNGNSPKALLNSHNGILVFASPYVLKDPELRPYIVAVDGFKPSIATIRSDDYPLAAPIFIYIKVADLKTNKGLKNFLKYIYSDKNTDNDVLGAAGFVPLSPGERAEEFYKITREVPNFYAEKPALWRRMIPSVPGVFSSKYPEPKVPSTFKGTPLDRRNPSPSDPEYIGGHSLPEPNRKKRGIFSNITPLTGTIDKQLQTHKEIGSEDNISQGYTSNQTDYVPSVEPSPNFDTEADVPTDWEAQESQRTDDQDPVISGDGDGSAPWHRMS